MKEAGQSLLRGGVLIIGFVILVMFLTSLPGGQPEQVRKVAPTQTSPAVQDQPTSPVPSAIRGAPSVPPATTNSNPGQATGSFSQRRRNLPQPTESQAEMERRIRSYLDK